MMSECKRILNKEVGGEGLWQTDLSKCQGQQEGEVLEINPADQEAPSQDKRSDDDDKDDEVEELRGATEHSDVEENGTDAEMAGATELSDVEDVNADAEKPGATELSDGEDIDADVEMPGTQATERTQCDSLTRL